MFRQFGDGGRTDHQPLAVSAEGDPLTGVMVQGFRSDPVRLASYRLIGVFAMMTTLSLVR